MKKKLLAGSTNNKETINNTDHINLARFSALIPKTESFDQGNSASCDTNSDTLPYQLDGNYVQNFDVKETKFEPSQLSYSNPVEVSDFGTNGNTSSRVSSSTREVSSLSTSSSTLAFENSIGFASWPGIGGVNIEDGILVDLGFDSSNDVFLNGFGF